MCRLKANFNITHKHESIREENTIFIRLCDLIFREKCQFFLNSSQVYKSIKKSQQQLCVYDVYVLTIYYDGDYDVPINRIV